MLFTTPVVAGDLEDAGAAYKAGDTPKARIIQEPLDKEVNPAIASHGGYIILIDIADDRAYVELGGGCQGCGMVDVTLKQGVEVAIKGAVPSIVEVIDTTDHAGGDNLYYQGSKA
jgi:Fe/S biogenesis protein NfuA